MAASLVLGEQLLVPRVPDWPPSPLRQPRETTGLRAISGGVIKDDDPYDQDPSDLSVLDVRKCRKCGHRWAYIRQGGCINMKCDLAAKHACKLHVTAR